MNPSIDELKQYVGEAYFYRAMIFFDLARVLFLPACIGYG